MKNLLPTLILFLLFSCTNTNTKEIRRTDDLSDNSDNKNKELIAEFDSTQLSKSAEMLDENKYWEIIDKSIKATTNQEDQERFLISEVQKLSTKEMIGFRLRTDQLLYDTYNSDIWCAGYIMNGGCSDDGFEYFRCWIISRGKDTYYKAKKNPDYLINEVGKGIDVYEFESFWYVALEAFNHVTGKDLYNYIDNGNFKTKEGAYPQFEFTWKEDNPESMKKICPKLFDKFNN